MAKQVRAGKAFVELGVREKMAAGLAAAQRKLRDFGRGAVVLGGSMVGSAASVVAPLLLAAGQAQEVRSKFDTVFADSRDQMREWSESFAGEIGRSKTVVEGFLSSSQDLFVPIGFDAGTAAEMSKTVTQLSIDIGSFNNRADADVMNDLQAALTGSGEVMKKYGVILSEAAVKQELLNRGMDPKTATEAQKTQARLALIMAGTTAAQGDAARTSGSFTNQLKALTASASDLAVQLGDHLIPPATAVLQWLNRGVGAVSAFAQRNATLTQVVLGVVAGVGAVGGILVALGGAALVGSVLIGGITSAMGVIASIASAVAGPALVVAAVLGVIGAVAYTQRDRIMAFAMAFWDAIAPVRAAVAQMLEVITTTFAAVLVAFDAGGIRAAGAVLWDGLVALFFRGAAIAVEAFQWLVGRSREFMTQIVNTIASSPLGQAAIGLWTGLRSVFSQGQQTLGDRFGAFTSQIVDKIASSPLGQAAIRLWNGLLSVFSQGQQALGDRFGAFTSGMTAPFFRAAGFIGGAFSWIWNEASGMVKGIADALLAGDISLAGEVVWSQLLLLFAQGQAALQRGWAMMTDGLTLSLLSAASAAAKILRSMVDQVLGLMQRGLSGLQGMLTALALVDRTGAAAAAQKAVAIGNARVGNVRSVARVVAPVAETALNAVRERQREELQRRLAAIDARVAEAKQRRDEALAAAGTARADKTFASEADRRLKALQAQAVQAQKLVDDAKVDEVKAQAEQPAGDAATKTRTAGSFSAVGAALLGLGAGGTDAQRTAKNTEEMNRTLKRIEERPAPPAPAFA